MSASEIARAAYRAAIPAGAVGDVATCQEAVSREMLARLASGEISRAEEDADWARQWGVRAHEREKNSGKRLIKKYLDGQIVLADLLDDAIIPLGEGQNVRFGDLDAEKLQLADQLRFVNMTTVEDEYRDWRLKLIAKLMPELVRRGCTVREL